MVRTRSGQSSATSWRPCFLSIWINLGESAPVPEIDPRWVKTTTTTRNSSTLRSNYKFAQNTGGPLVHRLPHLLRSHDTHLDPAHDVSGHALACGARESQAEKGRASGQDGEKERPRQAARHHRRCPEQQWRTSGHVASGVRLSQTRAPHHRRICRERRRGRAAAAARKELGSRHPNAAAAALAHATAPSPTWTRFPR